MSPEEFIEKLREIDFFEHYTPTAQATAEEQIRGNLQRGLEGVYEPEWKRKWFEMFPGLSLFLLEYDREWDAPLAEFVEKHKREALGLFQPSEIIEREDDEKNTVTVGFVAGGKSYCETFEYADGWIPDGLVSMLSRAFANSANGLMFHVLPLDDGGLITICTREAYKRLVRRKLVPRERRVLWDS